MTAEDDQAPGGVGEQVSELHVDGLHERAAQLLHRLIGAADALRARINDQIALRLPRIAAAGAVELGCRRLAIRQMDFPLDLRLGAGDLSHLRHRTGGILGVFVDAKTRALPFDLVLRDPCTCPAGQKTSPVCSAPAEPRALPGR